MEFLQGQSLPSFVKNVETIKCQGKKFSKKIVTRYPKIQFSLPEGNLHLKEFFTSIVAKGGEGVMLREPQSMYKSGRSESLKKYKPFFDSEVQVLENNYPHGFNCKQ
jgi:DNA ligase-1